MIQRDSIRFSFFKGQPKNECVEEASDGSLPLMEDEIATAFCLRRSTLFVSFFVLFYALFFCNTLFCNFQISFEIRVNFNPFQSPNFRKPH